MYMFLIHTIQFLVSRALLAPPFPRSAHRLIVAIDIDILDSVE